MLLEPTALGEIFRSIDSDGDALSCVVRTTASGEPAVLLGVIPREGIGAGTFVVLSDDEAVSLLTSLGPILYGVPSTN